MRSGLIAEKIGMSRIISPSGVSVPVTLLKVFECTIVEHKTQDKSGYTAVKMAYGTKKPKNVTKPLKGIYAKFNIEPAQGMLEFRVEEKDLIPVGEKIAATHFAVGSFLDVTGTTVGKGFAGVMKRHNFGGLRATHGVSVSHRSHGSTGQRQDPGKVFKGKKMAGHMGDVRVTQQNLEVMFINDQNNTLAVKGCVPGAAGGLVLLRDAVKKSS
jgi:large subunit ribosomal protein L3